ncbi:cation:proton antiporter [Legionella pneumophila]|uniref:cation:proton antiporter n=1 Tax=Legionella pneumophila TaxID=446 RepID=UPI0004848A1C|nr:cation:proton antiporter [Legionella pneumophila]MCK1860920.1 cation:proton antiporter [Legionella pneumophila]MDW9029246.1 cation:proton antiporter [Legionella pneumophila]MDW9152234.1 cation:proton antiporter [Legionella pneumophila]MDW9170882.1 cation:proton antiporter [Legionella pneumophila]MDW9193046.1 cation:proton antiporter [Legionella pneumophila]
MSNSKWWFLLVCFIPAITFASEGGEHSDPVTSVLLGVTTILFLAIIGRYLARLLNQPGVLGELLIGMIVGNLSYFFGSELVVILREGSAIYDVVKEMLAGISLNQAVTDVIHNSYYANQVIQALSGAEGTEYLKIAYVVDIFSRYGVIFLLFMVGLETSLSDLKKTGKESILVAVIGIVAPMILGFVVACFIIPNSSYKINLFIGATLSATSIGITASVLKEMNKLSTREARTILGAATLDDILGLIILAVVSSIVISGAVSIMVVMKIIILALLFFIGTLFMGPFVLRKAVDLFRFLEPWESKLFISFLFIMALAWLASFIQLAAIIGAFAAGVILHDDYFGEQKAHHKDHRSIHHLVSPLETILAPMFFTLIGIQVKLETFYDWNVIVLAGGLSVAAILGKLLSGLGANRRDDRLLIGIGMLPRGEVGLVFASIGRTIGVISDNLFTAIVLMIMITTFIAPPLLKMRYARPKEDRNA